MNFNASPRCRIGRRRLLVAVILWNESLELGIEEIDEQHRVIVGMINELDRAIQRGDATGTANRIVQGLISYGHIRFTTEEST
ncbi:MAG: hypothetical protein MZV63_30705 [Marinilabiliales bacterium]|nr:hypothetical protein [Marinilabiliales bacterium]